MIYLILAIFFGSMFTVIYKICQQKGADSLQVTMLNYVVAFIAGIVPIVFKLVFTDGVSLSDYSLPGNSLLFCLLQGILFFIVFYVLELSVRHSGVALSTLASKASLVLPVILSWLFLGQSAPKWLSVGLILAALVLLVIPIGGAPSKSEGRKGALGITLLLLVFIIYGTSDFMLKLSQHSVEGLPSTHLDMMMCGIFLIASLTALIAAIAGKSFKKSRLSRKTVIGGLALGIANVGCTFSVLHGLASISTAVFFPIYNVGAVILATTVGIIAFKERMSWIQALGMLLALGAIVLLYI